MSLISPLYRSAFVPHDLAAPIAGAASGPLAGLTAAVKDMYDIAGYRTGGGNPDWLETHPPAAKNAGAVQRILDAGATVIGKTVCDEFFFSVTGANAHYGTPVNPRAPGRLPGGSSSGSAVGDRRRRLRFRARQRHRRLGAHSGCRSAASTVCGRRTAASISPACMAMAPSFDVAGWFANGPGVFRKVGAVLLDERRLPRAIRTHDRARGRLRRSRRRRRRPVALGAANS